MYVLLMELLICKESTGAFALGLLLNHVRELREQARVLIADDTIGQTLDTFHEE